MTFVDRQDAGRKLAQALTEYKDKDVVVYALPRGGVVLGAEVAGELNAPLDLVITRKIGHPLSSEFAVCAISEDGELLCNEKEKILLNPEYIEEAVKREKEEAVRRRNVYSPDTKHISATGKVAIIVDDGIATGLTIRVAIKSIRKENPKELVVAVPTAPHELIEQLKKEADTVISLNDTMSYFGSVGENYESFSQVSDEEVVELLKKHRL